MILSIFDNELTNKSLNCIYNLESKAKTIIVILESNKRDSILIYSQDYGILNYLKTDYEEIFELDLPIRLFGMEINKNSDYVNKLISIMC